MNDVQIRALLHQSSHNCPLVHMLQRTKIAAKVASANVPLD